MKFWAFPSSENMSTLRYKRQLAAVPGETQEDSRNSQSQNTFVPGITEEYIMQVSEEIEERVTKKLSQEFSGIKTSILGALSKSDEFLLNPQLQRLTRIVSEPSRNNKLEKQEPTKERSQSDAYPELELSTRWISNSVDSDQE